MEKKGLWDVKGLKAPVWYTKDAEGFRNGEIGKFDDNPASPHGEAAQGFTSVTDLLAGHVACKDDNGKLIQHLSFVKASDLADEETGKKLRAIGIRHPGWWRWRMISDVNGVVAANIDAECLVFVHDHDDADEPAEKFESNNSDEDPNMQFDGSGEMGTN